MMNCHFFSNRYQYNIYCLEKIGIGQDRESVSVKNNQLKHHRLAHDLYFSHTIISGWPFCYLFMIFFMITKDRGRQNSLLFLDDLNIEYAPTLGLYFQNC